MEEEQKKSRYTDAQHKAINKYRANRATIEINLTREQKEQVKQAAISAGMSINQYILNKIFS